MGTDIHGPWLEQKLGDSWICLARFTLQRNYPLFGLMAGVRGETALSYPPRGIPENISWQVTNEYTELHRLPGEEPTDEDEIWEMGDVCWRAVNPNYHSASYLNVYQFNRVVERYELVAPYDTITLRFLRGIAFLLHEVETPEQGCRLVFWFDS